MPVLSATPDSWVFGNAWMRHEPRPTFNGRHCSATTKSLGIYRCPADKSTVRDQGSIPRTRSYSLSMVHATCGQTQGSVSPLATGIGSSRDHAIRARPRRWCSWTSTRTASLQGLFPRQPPGLLRMNWPTVWTWLSFPATRHGNAGTVSFADGHAELWHWKEQTTLKPPNAAAWPDFQTRRAQHRSATWAVSSAPFP